MNYLGIDYGLAHIGIAISEGYLTEPLTQIPNLSDEQSAQFIAKICQEKEIDTVITGLSENKMAERIKDFVATLRTYLQIPVILQDETLSSQEAVKKLIEAGAGKQKRQNKQHQTAAAIILQNYLDGYTQGLYSD